MTDYTPTSRRPIADVFRKTAHLAVKLCVRWNIHPDVISYLSVVAALCAASCFLMARSYPVLLLVAPVFCYIRLWFNMLDGMVALAANKASLHGEIVNELPDRISDVVIFAGVAHSGYCLVPLGYWAAIMAVFTAYVGIFGQAVGVQREFSGMMAKPWRMIVVHAGAWAMFFTQDVLPVWNWSALDIACLAVIAGCLQTVVLRLKRIVAALNAKAGDGQS